MCLKSNTHIDLQKKSGMLVKSNIMLSLHDHDYELEDSIN